jgi:two-component system copper resistance phosphate regulon response regulator CusR
MNLLIVEDEPRARAYLEKGLTEAGFTVDTVGDGEAGLVAARQLDYAAIVCDVMLPKRDGFSLVAELRRSGRQTPVLFVTARDEIDARVKGLELGGDDYIVKPFAFAELLARLRALLRRAAIRPVDRYAVGDLICDPRSRRVERAGRRIDLTPREFALLLLLLDHAGETVARAVIADRVWGMNFDSDTNVIDVHVRRLRAKIEPPGTPPLIHTVRGVGYVLDDRGGTG